MEALPSKTSAAIPQGDTAADEPPFEADAQIFITIQISQTLQPELFAELTRAKKRDRAGRARWLCQRGLTAERQVARHASFSTQEPSGTPHEFTASDQRLEPPTSQLSRSHSASRPPDSREHDPSSMLCHPDIGALLL